MAIEVFNRYEIKYILTNEICEKIQLHLSEYMELDEYNKNKKTYTISNLYYDTPDNYLIRTSLQKPKYKEKLRIRAYGVPGANEKVYVEIKKKVAGLVNKRRSSLELNEAYEFFNTGIIPDAKPYQNRQVLNEISYMLQTHNLCPAVYLSYNRKAYFGIGKDDLRISFDCNIRTRRHNLFLESGDYGFPILDDGLYLMEIKSAQSIPVWLSKLLSECKVYPTSFSKYGAEYKKMLSEKEPQIIYNYQTELEHLKTQIEIAV